MVSFNNTAEAAAGTTIGGFLGKAVLNAVVAEPRSSCLDARALPPPHATNDRLATARIKAAEQRQTRFRASLTQSVRSPFEKARAKVIGMCFIFISN
jgi:hypothetical protein